jgi:hypothetical protein
MCHISGKFIQPTVPVTWCATGDDGDAEFAPQPRNRRLDEGRFSATGAADEDDRSHAGFA